MKPARTPLVLAVLTGVVWQNFGQDALFFPSHVVSIALAIGVPITYFFIGKQRGAAVAHLQRGAILLSIAALPMLIANGLYLSYRSADGAAGDIGGILIMLLGWAALVGTSAFLIGSSSSAQRNKAAR
jgi:ABC-type transport system involved in cytochrome c biogenesis permease component